MLEDFYCDTVFGVINNNSFLSPARTSKNFHDIWKCNQPKQTYTQPIEKTKESQYKTNTKIRESPELLLCFLVE